MWGGLDLNGFKHQPKLKDHTLFFFQMLHNISRIQSAIILNLGGRGSGKTVLMMILASQLALKNNCAIVFFQCPKSFMDKLRAKAPPDLVRRIFRIELIRELDKVKKRFKHIILCYDEAILELNAKQALTKKARRLEKLMAISRQKDLWFIYNAQVQNVNKTMRMMTDIRIYKGNTQAMIEESDNKFAQKYKKAIVKLYRTKEWSFFESSFADLRNEAGDMITQGKFFADMGELIPWWDSELSRAYEGEEVSFDVEYDDFSRNEEKIYACAKIYREAYPNISSREVSKQNVKGFLYRNNHRALLYDIGDELDMVVSIIKDELFEQKQQQTKANAPQLPINTGAPIAPMPSLAGTTLPFADYIREKVAHATNERNLGEIVFLWANGASHRIIAESLNISRNIVGPILKDFEQSGIRGMDQIRSGYLFEDWFAEIHGGDARGSVPHNEHTPDFIDAHGRIYTLKCQANTEATQRFRIPGDCGPEHDAAMAANTTFFFVNMNVKWGLMPQIREVDPKLLEPAIVFTKQQQEIYALAIKDAISVV